MTTERERITDEDLARIEVDLSTLDPDATEYHWIAAAHVRRLLKALPALVAAVREARAEVKAIDDANTALGSQVIDLMRERDEAGEALADPITLLEGLAQKVSDSNGGFSSVDLPPPCIPDGGLPDAWEAADYVAVRWHPEDGFDYQLGIGGDEEMDKRHVTREKAVALLALRRAARILNG